MRRIWSQPRETDGSNPFRLRRDGRVHHARASLRFPGRELARPGSRDAADVMNHGTESGDRYSLSDVADIAAAAALAARLAVRFKPGFPGDFQSERDAESLARPSIVAPIGDASLETGDHGLRTRGSGRPTRSAGLGSGSTRTSTADTTLLLMSRNSTGIAAAGKMSREWSGIAYLGLGDRKYVIPHHPIAHDAMMGVTDAAGSDRHR